MKRIQAERSVLGALGATVLTLYVLVAWTRELQIGWLIAALATYVSAVVLALWSWRRRAAMAGALPAALGLLLLALGGATYVTWQFDRIARHWPELVAERESRLAEELKERMQDLMRRAHAAAEQAAAAAASRGAATDMFRPLEALRQQHDIDALALYTDDGSLIAWAGQHRGMVPDTIWAEDFRAYFEERPLFSYVYFPVHVPGRDEHVIAAVLVETGLSGVDQDSALAGLLADRTQARATFRRRGGGDDAIWSLEIGGDTIVHARLEEPTQADEREALERSGVRAVVILLLLAFVAWCAAWLRATGPTRPAWAALVPLLAWLPIGLAAPLGTALGLDDLFSPVLFALPVRDLSLGRLLALILPLAALILGARRALRPVQRLAVRLAIGAIVVAASYPFVLHFLFSATTAELLKGPPEYWYGFQLALVVILATITVIAMPRAAGSTDDAGWLDEGRQRGLVVSAILLSALLALGFSFATDPERPLRFAASGVWILPFALGAVALAPTSGRSGAFSRLLLAGWLAGTAMLPHVWRVHMQARLEAAEQELSLLGSRTDPFLHFILEQFANQLNARVEAGESGVQLLYRSWVASGLANGTYPSRVVLWADTVPLVQLGSAPMPRVAGSPQVRAIIDSARGQSTFAILEFTDFPDMSRLLTVPLPDSTVVTVMVPPRRRLERVSAIAPFLGGLTPSTARLNLVEASGPVPVQDTIEWRPGPTGWRSEAFVKYPEGWYHAHLEVEVPPVGVRLARGMLLVTFDLVVLALLWIIGVIGRGGAAVPRGDWRNWLDSFRARITIALFTFFLIPTAVFGWVAYTALAGEVERVAQTSAQHSAARAVTEFQEGMRDLRELASHMGVDVLRYMNGELIDVSSREALDLGVYSAWLPPDDYTRLESGEDVATIERQQLGGHAYLVAYHTLPPSGTLGIPMSLSSGETAVRQREFAHLVLFAAIVGALLSLALSLAVGRALAGPIGQLRRASAAVGAGRFDVQLPEREGGEFGQLFASFNRMARRLRRARARELRTARVLAWGEMARQVAHEIKNPLTPIKLAVQHLRRAHADRHDQFDEILDRNVTQILTEIDRLSEIARAFSRYGAPAPASGPLTAVDAPAVIREALTLYRSGDRGVRYIEDVQPGLPRVRARTDELKEVVLNLIENARAALDGSGDIIISAYTSGEDRVDIDIADNGPGIPRELLARVFEPHFSTRSSGTGLGLAIVRRLVESWGGTVTADSAREGGTVIRISLVRA